MRKTSLLASLLAAASFSALASASPANITLAGGEPAQAGRRASNGPGTKAHQRVALKRRNVQRNRRAHRG